MRKAEYSELIDQPLPEIASVSGWKETPLKPSSEPLVALGPFTNFRQIFTNSLYYRERTDSPYPEDHLEGSLLTMFVRQSIARRLAKAQELLTTGFHLMVWDAYRSVQLQGTLFKVYLEALQEKYPDWSNDQLMFETQKYVSMPSTDATRPSPHNTGGSVDVSIVHLGSAKQKKIDQIDRNWKKIPMQDWKTFYEAEMERLGLITGEAELPDYGTKLDHGGEESGLTFYEDSKENIEARSNRRFLFHLMRKVGMEAYIDEWWHFNAPESQMGAKTAGLPFARFGATNLTSSLLEHEEMRKNHRLGSVRLWQSPFPREKVSIIDQVRYVATQAALRMGDYRKSNLPEAAIIKP